MALGGWPGRKSTIRAAAGLAAGIVLLASATGVAAQDVPADLERRIRELERRKDALEKHSDDLEARLAEVERARGGVAPPSSASAAELAPPEPDGEPEGAGLGLSVKRGIVALTLQLFGNVDFAYRNPRVADHGHAGFVEGTLDLCVSSAIGDHVHVLSETVVEGDTDSGDVHLDQERLWGRWNVRDVLYLKLGVEHSPTCHWNRELHHGRWMWTTASHPLVARFEDEGGLLPMHQTGLEAGGRLETPLGTLEYVGVVSNGRGRFPGDRMRVFGLRDGFAYDVGLALSPSFAPGFTIGGNFHADEIPPVAGDPSRRLHVRELIESGHVSFRAGGFEVLGELAFVSHKDRTAGRTYHHHTAYLQASQRIGDFSPYARIDVQTMENGDPFYGKDDRDLSQWIQLFGVRYEPLANVVVKLECGFGREQVREPSTNAIRRQWELTTAFELAWVF